ncbi:hypothetical protein H6F86_12140 [Phormidium sp. FACHB-592]|uniref:Uncharacterized protein n=1 Tax=Stenomitos frigidus AS-A4 TaxID=2933935 RepID=A0ABV0KSP7_9CYAN|nr:hypothetical protein [Phormidium sp. FACHB-592]MBD2074624.1 hypothetical protein [Phormidium sp. FACHB-592]
MMIQKPCKLWHALCGNGMAVAFGACGLIRAQRRSTRPQSSSSATNLLLCSSSISKCPNERGRVSRTGATDFSQAKRALLTAYAQTDAAIRVVSLEALEQLDTAIAELDAPAFARDLGDDSSAISLSA